ncbi:neural-cadherin [Trichonephila clavipes]|nr:neural-cadherin [Trichonephila clavipes]
MYGQWVTTFATSLILNSPILPCTVYFYHGGTRKAHKAVSEMLPPLTQQPRIVPFSTSDKLIRFCITPRTANAVFSQPLYSLNYTVLPSVIGYLPSTSKVTATDGDRDRTPDIVYFLTGQGVDDQDPANSKFAINTTTGEIYVLKPLDRDLPHGRSQWRFTVFAEDEGGNGLVGYADVLVNLKDINDNAPFFPYAIYTGNVTENGTADRSECAFRNCWEQWTREGTHERKTGSRATRKTTRREDRRIVWQALVDPTVTRSTIRADAGVAIVPQTISRHLAEANLKSKCPLRAPSLTPEHRQLHLQWCQA